MSHTYKIPSRQLLAFWTVPWTIAAEGPRLLSHSIRRRTQVITEWSPAYDAHSQQTFLLKAHLVLVTGDTPGVSKLFHLSGHNAKHPCRACKLEGTPYVNYYKSKKGQERQITTHYYPPRPPAASFQRNGAICIDVSKFP